MVVQVTLARTSVARRGGCRGSIMTVADLGPLLRGDPVQWLTALLIEARLGTSYDAVRTQDYLYAEHLTGESELYDMTLDPGQLGSLHADPGYAAIKAALAAQLHVLQSCNGATCWLQ